MKIKVHKKTAPKRANRLKKKQRIRKKIFGTEERPRLCLFRSLKHITVQAIDDVNGKTLVSASTLEMKSSCNKEGAANLAKEFVKKAQAKKLVKFVFDRNGYLYHGKVKAFAEAAREAGLNF